jgi:hypothetical protein
MKINDLFETQQDEGIGSALGKVAGGIGKAVGGAVGGIGALGSAVKSGYKAGKVGAQNSILGTSTSTVAQQQGIAPVQGNTPQANATPVNAQQGTAPAVNQTQQADQTAEPAGNQGSAAMSNMAGQMQAMAPPEATSTGGQVKQTATGQVNTASPNNPNAQQQAPAQQYTGPDWDEVTGAPLSPKAKADYEKLSPELKAQVQQNIANQTAAPSHKQKAAKVGVPAGKQAVDQAVQTIASVRGDRRPQVVQYAKEKIDSLAKQSAAAPELTVQQGGKAPTQQAAEGFHSRFLGMKI